MCKAYKFRHNLGTLTQTHTHTRHTSLCLHGQGKFCFVYNWFKVGTSLAYIIKNNTQKGPIHTHTDTHTLNLFNCHFSCLLSRTACARVPVPAPDSSHCVPMCPVQAALDSQLGKERQQLPVALLSCWHPLSFSLSLSSFSSFSKLCLHVMLAYFACDVCQLKLPYFFFYSLHPSLPFFLYLLLWLHIAGKC